MQTTRDPYMAPLCLAALLLSTYACRGMGESQRAQFRLQVNISLAAKTPKQRDRLGGSALKLSQYHAT